MADLPEERLEASTAFTNVGVDYFGPFIVTIGRRKEKRWCFLFTCLTMGAVHIEVVPKLDIYSCLNAIMSFIARRGKSSAIISDNGTNFVGAERVCRVRCGMEQRRDRRTSKTTRNQMEIQSTRSTSLWWSMEMAGEKLRESNVCSVGEQISHR